MASSQTSTEIERLLGRSFEVIMATNQDHTALDHLIVDEQKHQPYLVSLLDSPTVLSEPWKPTSTVGMDEMGEFKKGIIHDYMDIRLNPYSPRVWIGRAGTLLSLRYDELAVGDTYKGRLLLDTLRKQTKTSVIPEKGSLPFLIWKEIAADILPKGKDEKEFALSFQGALRRLETMAFLTMAQALISIRAFYDAVHVLEDALKRFPSTRFFSGLLQHAKEGVNVIKDNNRP
ncbi:hypothetical protein MMC30_006973 [Trapelia coarctata]|nr:hypothetical protein [Trapelia coarctata]